MRNRHRGSGLISILFVTGVAGCAHKPPAVPQAAQHSAGAVLPVPSPVNASNFVSLEIETQSGWGYSSDLVVRDGSLSKIGRDAGKTRKRVLQHISLSQAEKDAVIAALNTANFPSLAGNYRQSGLFDATSTTVTLVLKQGAGQKTFRVFNYGSLAPKPFYAALNTIHGVLDPILPSH